MEPLAIITACLFFVAVVLCVTNYIKMEALKNLDEIGDLLEREKKGLDEMNKNIMVQHVIDKLHYLANVANVEMSGHSAVIYFDSGFRLYFTSNGTSVYGQIDNQIDGNKKSLPASSPTLFIYSVTEYIKTEARAAGRFVPLKMMFR